MHLGAIRATLARVFAVAAALTLLLALTTSVASAHERRQVGEYTFVVGFRVEPALIGEVNGLDLRVSIGEGDNATPVEGLAETLEAEITYGGETMPLELRAVFSAPGRYTADVIPTATGAYSFRVFGTIEGTQIDETFTSGPDTFSEVGDTADLSFPGGAMDAESGSGDDDDSSQTLAIVALVAGLLGLGAGVGAMLMARGAANRPGAATVEE